jgi:hypothetical protein
VLVALLAQRAEVKYDPENLLPSQIAGLIKDLGFRAQVLETAVHGMDIIDVNVRIRMTLNYHIEILIRLSIEKC